MCPYRIFIVIAILLWLIAAAGFGGFIYDYSFAARVSGGIWIYSGHAAGYYSRLSGGGVECFWLNILFAAGAVFALVGAAVFVAGFSRRVKVTNAGVTMKKPFTRTLRLTWDRISSAHMETDTMFCICSEEKRYHFSKLVNQEEVFRTITEMISLKNAGTLKMPTVCGIRSVIGRFRHKKALAISVASAAALVIFTPVIVGMFAKQVNDVPYEWRAEVMLMQNSGRLDNPIAEITIKGTYTGKWLNGKPYGTGTIVFDHNYRQLFYPAEIYTGTWKNGEPSNGKLLSWNGYEIYSGGFKHSMLHGYGRYTDQHGNGKVIEGNFKYGNFPKDQ